MMRSIAAAAALLAAGPVLAQAAPPAAQAADIDPARLASATRLVDAVMPASLRDNLINQTTGTMMANVNRSVLDSPQMTAMFQKQPRARAIVERYMAQQADETRVTMRETMPAMMTVMARAYARRLTVAQMEEAQRFFATAAGQAYVFAAPAVMADPEFAALMQTTMAKAMARMPVRAKAMLDELKALESGTTTN
ncbi:DUF2059 domain-containing protein [Polymorphobacter fuscus]|nr:DUF2059 domain-containing protein [Polymorphobacter fuscus]